MMKYIITFAVFLLLTLLFAQSVYDRTAKQFALLRDSVLTLRQVIADKDSLIRDKDSTLKERDSVLSQMQTPYPYNMTSGRSRITVTDRTFVDSTYRVIPDRKLKYYYNVKDATDTLISYDSTPDTTWHGVDRKRLISEFPSFDLYDPATGLWRRYDPTKHDTLPSNHVYEYVDTVYIYVQGNNDTFVLRHGNDPWPWEDLHMLHRKAAWDSLMKANKRDTGQFKFIPYEYKK